MLVPASGIQLTGIHSIPQQDLFSVPSLSNATEARNSIKVTFGDWLFLFVCLLVLHPSKKSHLILFCRDVFSKCPTQSTYPKLIPDCLIPHLTLPLAEKAYFKAYFWPQPNPQPTRSPQSIPVIMHRYTLCRNAHKRVISALLLLSLIYSIVQATEELCLGCPVVLSTH